MSIISGVGAPGTVGPASGGKVYAYNSISTLITVVPANTARRKLTFHNPGPVDILIGPASAFTSAAAVAPLALVPTTANYGGCFRVFSNGGTLIVEGECQGAWQGLTSDATTGKLTVMDSNTG